MRVRDNKDILRAMLLPHRIETDSISGLSLYLLGYMGAVSLAIMAARIIPERFVAPVRNEFFRSFFGIGIPVFAFTTLYHWAFPTHISFAEHVIDNLVMAILVSWAWRFPIRTSQ